MTYVVKVNRKHMNFDVYIGREWAGLPQSKWHNPFHEWEYGRTAAIALYEAHIRLNDELMAAIPELVDKVLGCWCYPEPCHGDVLLKLVKEYQDANGVL
jgi:hypothetical protein